VKVAGLLLAAGAGRRFGTPKALVTVDGLPLVIRGVRLLGAAGCAPLFVTVGAAADEVVAAVRADNETGPTGSATRPAGSATRPDEPIPGSRDTRPSDSGPAGSGPEVTGAAVDLATRTVRVADWAEGMGASLRAGLAAVAESEADAVVIALVDQPRVTPALVRRLIASARGDGAKAAVVAGFAGQPRNPVLLRREIWPEVARLAQGDVGARAWLRAHPDRVLVVDCDDLGMPDDIDTPADLARLTSTRRAAASGVDPVNEV
jgi:molybdenum cofactor cytidylyltransferase/nicotine blue oxidoreductase